MEALLVLLVLTPFILLFVYIVRTHILAGRVKALEKKMSEVQDTVLRLQRPRPAPGSAGAEKQSAIDLAAKPAGITVPPAEVRPAEPSVPSAPPLVASPLAASPSDVRPSVAPPPMAPRPVAVPVPRKTRSRGEWEALIGGKLLNRIGAFALIIGMGFFLKYAFDNNWITEPMRVIIGAAIGLSLIGGGMQSERKGYAVFAQGLIGAGIAILYLSVYAAFGFYGLVPQLGAFILMSIVTAITLALAIRYDSLAVALLGWAGGFLTPIMLSTGQSNEIGLFSYIALLDIGLVAIMYLRRQWILLEPVTIIATYVTYFAWYDAYFGQADFAVSLFFTTVFWLLFLTVDVARALESGADPGADAPSAGSGGAPGNANRYPELRHIFGAGNAVFFFACLVGLFEAAHPRWESAAFLLLALAYAVLAIFLRRRRSGDEGTLSRMTITAITLLAVATAVELRFFGVIIAWSVTGALLAHFGLRHRQRRLWIPALLLLALAFAGLLGNEDSYSVRHLEHFVPLLNERALALLAAGLAAVFTAARVSRSPEVNVPAWISPTLLVIGCAMGFFLPTLETIDYFSALARQTDWEATRVLEFNMTMILAGLWMAVSILYMRLGLARKRKPVAVVALVVLSLSLLLAAVRGIAYEPIGYFLPVANMRVLLLLVILAGLAMHRRLRTRDGEGYPLSRVMTQALPAAMAVVGFVLLTGETRDFFRRQIEISLTGAASAPSDLPESIENLKQLLISSVWLLYSIALMIVGIARRARVLRIASFALFGIAILKIFIYDLSYLQTLYRIFSFFGLGLILLVVSYLYQRYKNVIFGDEAARDASGSDPS